MRTQDQERELYEIDQDLIWCAPEDRPALEAKRAELVGEPVAYAIEPWESIEDEITPYWRRHGDELAADGSLLAPVAPDWDTYRRLADAGLLHAVIARAAGEIVGFFFFLTVPHFHASTTPLAMAHLAWTAPEHRGKGIGSKLYRIGWAHAEALGAQVLVSGAKVGSPLTGMLERAGFRHTENLYVKRLAR